MAFLTSRLLLDWLGFDWLGFDGLGFDGLGFDWFSFDCDVGFGFDVAEAFVVIGIEVGGGPSIII